jgi:peptidoglycan/LPS O-acetylase OafA/YrhL
MDDQLVRTADLIGAITANIYFLLIISVFAMRLAGHPEVGRWVGLASFLVVIPLIWLFITAFHTNRSLIYFLWLSLMILFLSGELLIDYILKLEFRSVRWATVLYVIIFFGATGGMIGIVGQAGKWWTGATVFTFLVMAIMAFVQRAKTGL